MDWQHMMIREHIRAKADRKLLGFSSQRFCPRAVIVSMKDECVMVPLPYTNTPQRVLMLNAVSETARFLRARLILFTSGVVAVDFDKVAQDLGLDKPETLEEAQNIRDSVVREKWGDGIDNVPREYWLQGLNTMVKGPGIDTTCTVSTYREDEGDRLIWINDIVTRLFLRGTDMAIPDWWPAPEVLSS